MYTYMSLLFGSFLLITLIYEMVSLNTYEQPPITTKYLASLLVI